MTHPAENPPAPPTSRTAPVAMRPGLAPPRQATGPGDRSLAPGRRAVHRLQDVTEVEYRSLRLERVILVGVWTDGTLADAENSLRELSRLAETAGRILDGLVQRRGRPDAATYIGSGKAAEVAALVASSGADTVICDGELSPASSAGWRVWSRRRSSTGPR